MAGGSLDFPRFVFYVPGPNQAHGFTYDHVLVEDEKAFKDAIEAGYFENLMNAKDDFDTRDDKEPEPGLGTVSGGVAPKKRGRPAKAKGTDDSGENK